MLSLGCGQRAAERLVEEAQSAGILVIANVNGPRQTVASGTITALESLGRLARAQGIPAQILPVSNAFHSPLVEEAANQFLTRSVLPAHPAQIEGTLISSCDGCPVSASLDLPTHFASQIIRPVDFFAAASALKAVCDAVVEVGPGGVLSDLMTHIDASSASLAWPVERQAESFKDLNRLLGFAHSQGVPINWSELYASRTLRPFSPASVLSFITNPCERRLNGVDTDGLEPDDGADFTALVTADTQSRAMPAAPVSLPPVATVDTYATIAKIISKATGYAVVEIAGNHRLLDDLNLNSIKVTTVIAEICTALGLEDALDPTQWSNATLTALVEELNAHLGGSRAGVVGSRPTSESVVFDAIEELTGFDRAALLPDLSIIDDLNIDSIKLTELIARIESRLDLRLNLDAAPRRIATIADLTQQVETLIAGSEPRAMSSVNPNAEGNGWVRPYVLSLRQVETRPVTGDLAMSGAPVLIHCDPNDRSTADALAGALTTRGARVLLADDEQLLTKGNDTFERMIVLVPACKSAGEHYRDLLNRAIRVLRNSAVASSRQAGCNRLLYVQFDGLGDLVDFRLEPASERRLLCRLAAPGAVRSHG